MTTEAQVAPSRHWLDWAVALRLHHWPKCLVVLVGLLPTGAFRDARAVALAIAAAVVFQAAAAGGYLVNDVLDARRDRLHPRKRRRPVAAGRIAAPAALAVALALILVALAGSWLLAPELGVVIGGYILLTLCYSLWLKHAPAADILTIAVIFVLRAVAGVVVIGKLVSFWFLAAVGALALLLALGKRLGEIDALTDVTMAHRKTLRSYRSPAWQVVLWASAAATIVCYALAATSSPTAHRHALVVLTTVPVVVGVWQYCRLARLGGGAEPERLLLHDRVLAGCVCAWALSLGVVVMA
jgi:decaprenyl-phosphate phosphoribosyltransferase